MRNSLILEAYKPQFSREREREREEVRVRRGKRKKVENFSITGSSSESSITSGTSFLELLEVMFLLSWSAPVSESAWSYKWPRERERGGVGCGEGMK